MFTWACDNISMYVKMNCLIITKTDVSHIYSLKHMLVTVVSFLLHKHNSHFQLIPTFFHGFT